MVTSEPAPAVPAVAGAGRASTKPAVLATIGRNAFLLTTIIGLLAAAPPVSEIGDEVICRACRSRIGDVGAEMTEADGDSHQAASAPRVRHR